MSKNVSPPRPAPSALPDRLRNDGWWLREASQDTPAATGSDTRLIVIATRHLQEEQQWIQPIF
ncbi:hypothetical protein CPT32_04605 [Rhizobium sophoriradicis]|nr:hypothetical protein CPT32_04605 [Rhizobium sophoriradicis]